MSQFVKSAIYRFETSFFANVVKRGLGMMIPLVLVGGMACALRDFPIEAYQTWLTGSSGHVLYAILNMIYQGTFGIFSIAMVIALSLSYALEKM